MPILWEPTGEVDGEPVRGVRVSAQDWADAGVWRHEIRRRGAGAGNDARRETRQTTGGVMTERMESDEPRGGLVLVALAVLACIAFVMGVVVGAAGAWVTR